MVNSKPRRCWGLVGEALRLEPHALRALTDFGTLPLAEKNLQAGADRPIPLAPALHLKIAPGGCTIPPKLTE